MFYYLTYLTITGILSQSCLSLMFGFKIHLHLEDAFLIVCRQVLFSKKNQKKNQQQLTF